MSDPDTTRIISAQETRPVSSLPSENEVSRLRASLIAIEGWEIGQEVDLEQDETTFGRSMLNDTSVAESSISRTHCKIARRKEGNDEFFEIADLGSSNGTFVNGSRVTTRRLENGNKVRMGDVVFKFALQDVEDEQFHKNIHRLIHFDQLTGLLTMESFKRKLEEELARSSRDARFALAMTDLDGLKKVNDSFGHLAGRMIVGEMGAMMRAAVRPQDVAGLYGGDEAIVLFPSSRIEEAAEVAEKLRQAIEGRVFEHRGNTFQVTISQGLASFPDHGQTMDGVIAAADSALYEAKAAGRNCIKLAG